MVVSASGDGTVKIWDTNSGKCLHTLYIGKALSMVSFDSTGSYIHTEIGTITIKALSVSKTQPDVMDPQTPRRPQYQGIGLSPGEKQVIYNSEYLVWLPSEYRALCSAVSRKTIGIGCGSGRVWICNIEPVF